MGYKLGTVDGKAILIKENFYYDIATLSNGSISSDSVEALKSKSELSELFESLNKKTLQEIYQI